MEWIIAPLAVIAVIAIYGCIDYAVVQHRMNRPEREWQKHLDQERKNNETRQRQQKEAEEAKNQAHINAVNEALNNFVGKQFVCYCANIILQDYNKRLQEKKESVRWESECQITMNSIGFRSGIYYDKRVVFSEHQYAPLENIAELEAFTLAIMKLLPSQFTYTTNFTRFEPQDPPISCLIYYHLVFEKGNQHLKKIANDPF